MSVIIPRFSIYNLTPAPTIQARGINGNVVIAPSLLAVHTHNNTFVGQCTLNSSVEPGERPDVVTLHD